MGSIWLRRSSGIGERLALYSGYRSSRNVYAGRIVGANLAAQRRHHVDHSADGTGGRALRVAGHGPQVGHGMEGAVEIARAIDEQQRFLVGHQAILPCPARRPEPRRRTLATDTSKAAPSLQSLHA
jgi:hypothetical protein